MDKVKLTKKGFDKIQYKGVIDTSFKQLVSPPVVEPVQTVEEKISIFFAQYEELFYDIPKEGENSSHEYLIKQSSAYANLEIIDEDVQALLDEITSLREKNLELEQQIINQQAQGTTPIASNNGISDILN